MKRAALITVAAMAVSGGILLAQSDQPAVTPGVAPPTGSTNTDAQGVNSTPTAANTDNNQNQPGQSADFGNIRPDDGIRATIADMAYDVIAKGDLCQLSTHFTTNSRDRICQTDAYKSHDDAKFCDVGTRWNNDFGHDFDTARADNALRGHFASIDTGTPHEGPLGSRFEAATGVTTATNQHIAIINVQEGDGLPECQVAMVFGSNGWEVQIPTSLSAEQLRANLRGELSNYNANATPSANNDLAANDAAADQANQPQTTADERHRYRELSHRILLALSNQQSAAEANAPVTPAEGH